MGRHPFVFCGAIAVWALAMAPHADGRTLMQALREGDTVLAAKLIGKHSDVNTRDETGATPLVWAAQRGDADLIARLLKAGADPNRPAANGLGPLQIAIATRAAAAARLLLAKGARANIARDSGETALMTAARTGQIDIMEELIARGAQVNAHENIFHQTALMWSAGHPGQVQLLIEHGADVRARTKTWEVTNTIYRPLTAIGAGFWDDDGEYVSQKGGQSALFFAVQENDLQSVKALLEAGVDINRTAADGSTALLLALYKWSADKWDGGRARVPRFDPNLSIANLLLDRGARVNVADAAGYTPLHGAVLSLVPHAPSYLLVVMGNKESIGPLSAPGLPVDRQEGIAMVKRLLDLGADPNAASPYPSLGPAGAVRIDEVVSAGGSTPLHIAAVSADAGLVGLLLERGGDPNLIRKDGHSPFSLAIKKNDRPLVELLISRIANVARSYNPTDQLADPVKKHSRPRTRQTLMHIAAAAGAYEVIAILAEHGAPLTVQNDNGETPLALAAMQEQVRFENKKENAVDGPGNTPLALETKTSDAIRKALAEKKMATTASTSNAQ